MAEATDDLVPKLTAEDGKTYIDVEKGAGFKPSNLFAQIFTDCADSDVVLLPELVLDHEETALVGDALASMGSKRPRMVVCGSRLEDNGDEWPWNSSQVVNSSGSMLWSHRKVAAYGMLKDTFDNLKIPNLGHAKQLMEKISWSDNITIGDVEGLGRCVNGGAISGHGGGVKAGQCCW